MIVLNHTSLTNMCASRYFGTPRHLRIQPEIDWAGDINKAAIRMQWEPEVFMRIPAGSEFINPAPDNHFSNVFVFHAKSKTIHCDDTLLFFDNPGCLLSCCAGIKANQIYFHPTLSTVGLQQSIDAPYLFKSWVYNMIDDWVRPLRARIHSSLSPYYPRCLP
jgi:hypothetical protein